MDFHDSLVHDLVRLNERIDRAQIVEAALRLLAGKPDMPSDIRAKILAEADLNRTHEIEPLREERALLVAVIRNDGPRADFYVREKVKQAFPTIYE